MLLLLVFWWVGGGGGGRVVVLGVRGASGLCPCRDVRTSLLSEQPRPAAQQPPARGAHLDAVLAVARELPRQLLGALQQLDLRRGPRGGWGRWGAGLSIMGGWGYRGGRVDAGPSCALRPAARAPRASRPARAARTLASVPRSVRIQAWWPSGCGAGTPGSADAKPSASSYSRASASRPHLGRERGRGRGRGGLGGGSLMLGARLSDRLVPSDAAERLLCSPGPSCPKYPAPCPRPPGPLPPSPPPTCFQCQSP
jgi:hypothetical protein